jgi:hypothetical protein
MILMKIFPLSKAGLRPIMEPKKEKGEQAPALQDTVIYAVKYSIN